MDFLRRGTGLRNFGEKRSYPDHNSAYGGRSVIGFGPGPTPAEPLSLTVPGYQSHASTGNGLVFTAEEGFNVWAALILELLA